MAIIRALLIAFCALLFAGIFCAFAFIGEFSFATSFVLTIGVCLCFVLVFIIGIVLKEDK